jgi:cytoskeletal protein RodZ
MILQNLFYKLYPVNLFDLHFQNLLLKVRVKIIKDFENVDQIDLPGTAYKIGFVRSYARLLELDSDLLVKEFKESIEVNNFKEEYKFLSPEINSNKILPIGAVLSFFIALLVYSGWYYTDRSNSIDLVSNTLEEDENKKLNESHNFYYLIHLIFYFRLLQEY